MDLWGDSLEDLSRDQIRGLAERVMDGKRIGVQGPVKPVVKLGSDKRVKLRSLPGEMPDNTRPNDTISVTIQLPASLVVAMSDMGEHSYREAIRDYLVQRGIKWWYPRFLIRVDLPGEND